VSDDNRFAERKFKSRKKQKLKIIAAFKGLLNLSCKLKTKELLGDLLKKHLFDPKQRDENDFFNNSSSEPLAPWTYWLN
jgi:hypothetical protein